MPEIDAEIIEAAFEWRNARDAFIRLPAKGNLDAMVKAAFNRLSEAEDRLSRILTTALENEAAD